MFDDLAGPFASVVSVCNVTFMYGHGAPFKGKCNDTVIVLVRPCVSRTRYTHTLWEMVFKGTAKGTYSTDERAREPRICVQTDINTRTRARA